MSRTPLIRNRRAPTAPTLAARDDMVNRAVIDAKQNEPDAGARPRLSKEITLRVQGPPPAPPAPEGRDTSRTTELFSADQLGDFLIHSELVHEDRWNQAVEKAGKKNLHLLLEELVAPPDAEEDFTSTHLLRERRLTRYQIEQILSGRVSSLVLGPFIFRRRLGRGGTAEVLQAYNKELDRLEAVKVLRKDKVRAGIDLGALVRREARVLASLVHPNITTVYRADTTFGTTYLSMEYIPGETVEAKVSKLTKRGEYLPVREAVRIALETSFALAYAHSRHVIHRDVKPGNIMVTPDNRVKVLDVGIAALFAPEKEESFGKGATKELSTLAGFGTPHYVAPEQWKYNQTTESVDVYGLGATLFHMLVGRPPFADKDLEILLARKQEGAVNPSTLRNSIPYSLGQVVQKALAPDPTQRYPSMEAFAAALEPFVGDSRAAPRPPVPWLGVAGVVALAVIAIRLEPRATAPAEPSVAELVAVQPAKEAPPTSAPAQPTVTPVKAVATSETPVTPKPVAVPTPASTREPPFDVVTLRNKAAGAAGVAAWVLQNASLLQRQLDPVHTFTKALLEGAVASKPGVNPQQALEAADRALRLAPNAPRLLEQKAVVLVRLQRYDEAARQFDAGAQAAPAEAKRLRAEAADALRRLALQQLARREFKQAEQTLAGASQRYAEHADEMQTIRRDVLLQWATALIEAGDVAAGPVVAAARAAAPDRPEPIKLQAQLFEKSNDWKSAAQAWLAWGRAAKNERLGTSKAAAIWLRWAHEAVAAGDHRAAIERFVQARRLTPGDASVAEPLAKSHNLVGFALHQKGDDKSAIAEYTAALDALPRSAITYRNRGFSHLQLKNYEAALRDYTAAIDLDPKNAVAYRMRAAIRLLHLPTKDWKAILDDLSAASRLGPDDAKTNYFLAYVYASCPDKAHRDAAKAIEHADRACKATGYADWECLAMLAAALAEAGKYGDAVARIEQAERLAADKPALKALAETYRAKK